VGDLNAVVYGLLIIVFLLFEPGGVIGLIRRIQLLSLRLNHRLRKGGELTKASPDLEPDAQFEVESSTLSASKGTEMFDE
jgi:hypothetical protein